MIEQIAEARLLVEDDDHRQRIPSADCVVLRQSPRHPHFARSLSTAHQL